MTLVQYLTAVTIGVGGGCVVFWIYELGLRVLAWREARADAMIRARWSAEEVARMAPIRRMIEEVAAAHAAFWRERGWRPTRYVVPMAKAAIMFEPWSSFAETTFKQHIENQLGVEVVFADVEEAKFDRLVQAQ